MVFTKALKILSVLVVIISVLVILAEKYLPEQEELRRVEDLPEELRDWYQRGKYYNVFGHRVFAIWNGDSKGENLALTLGLTKILFQNCLGLVFENLLLLESCKTRIVILT
jgi:hypothetical protein